VLQVCARYSKNDKILMQKLRELKVKYQDGGNGVDADNGVASNA
jgi:hypothetical protein